MTDQPSRWSFDEGTRETIAAERRKVSGKEWAFRIVSCGVASGLAALVLFAFLYYREHIRPLRFPDGIPGSGVELIYDSRLGWRNAPNTTTTTFGQPMTVNSRGLRGREHPLKKPPGTSRILVLGDSFAWGYGVADDEVFTTVVEQELRGLTSNWEVINTGVSGWGTTQEYLYLMDEGFGYSPDIVVLAMFLGNDLANNSTSPEYGRHKPIFLDTDLELVNVPVPKPWDDAPMITTRADPVDLAVAIVLKMAEACAARKCAFVVVKFGNYVEPNNVEHKQTERRFEEGISIGHDIEYLDLDEYFAAHEITLHDLSVGSHQFHWNAFGHRQAARSLYEFLLSEELVR